MTSSEQYKRQIMNDLAQGNVESIDDAPANSAQEYENFDDFTQRSSPDERRQLFGQSLHPDKIPLSQMEPELQKAIAQIKPNERDDVARAFFKRLHDRGLSDRALEQQLGLSRHNPNRMSAEDVSKLASFAYHSLLTQPEAPQLQFGDEGKSAVLTAYSLLVFSWLLV